MKVLKNFWQKIKSIKHIQIYLAIFVALVVCAVYFVSNNPFKTKTDKTNENTTGEYSSTMEYVDNLENRISNVLSNMSGVGKVKVVVSLECGFSYEYAKDSETKTTVSGDVKTTVTSETIILVSNQPVVVKEIYPVVKGVVVVAEGAKDVSIKMNILSAIETIFEIDRQNIIVLT